MNPGPEPVTDARSAELLDRLPHRPPFRFLSCVRRLEVGEQGIGAWTITGDEWFFSGHFPGDAVVPGVLIVEALAQLSGLVGLHAEAEHVQPAAGRAGRLVHADIRFDAPVAPPAEIELRSTKLKSLQSLRRFEVAASVKGLTVARGSLVLAEVS